jgi:hypothetical protein
VARPHRGQRGAARGPAAVQADPRWPEGASASVRVANAYSSAALRGGLAGRQQLAGDQVPLGEEQCDPQIAADTHTWTPRLVHVCACTRHPGWSSRRSAALPDASGSPPPLRSRGAAYWERRRTSRGDHGAAQPAPPYLGQRARGVRSAPTSASAARRERREWRRARKPLQRSWAAGAACTRGPSRTAGARSRTLPNDSIAALILLEHH